MIGTYRFYQQGVLIAEQGNLITTQGKRLILQFLAQQTRQIAQAIGVGTSTTAASVNDTTLGFEFSRANISAITPNITDSKVIFKATIPVGIQGTINEVGLWSQSDNVLSGNFGSRLLLSFDSATEIWTGGSFVTDTTKIGGDSLRVSALASATSTAVLDGTTVSMVGFHPEDKVKLAYNNNDSNCSSIEIRFKNDNSNYFKFTISNPTSGYHITSFSKSAAVSVGTPDWDSIASFEAVVVAKAAGTTTVDFDGLRIEDTQSLNQDYTLVSHAILSSPLLKSSSKQMDIEYRLDVPL